MGGLKFSSLLILYAWHIKLVTGVRSGPFKSSYTRVEPCQSPTLPMDTNPPVSFFAELYNTTTDVAMRGKIIVFRDHKLKKMKAKSYLWDKNKWKVNYVINNMGCNRVFFPILVAMTGVNYDHKTCTFYKGEFVFQELNLNKAQHAWMKTQEYGKVIWKVEVFSNNGNVFCWEFETLIVPA